MNTIYLFSFILSFPLERNIYYSTSLEREKTILKNVTRQKSTYIFITGPNGFAVWLINKGKDMFLKYYREIAG